MGTGVEAGAVPPCCVLGDSKIGENTLLGPGVVVGHPTAASLRKRRAFLPEHGAFVGRECILRSGTVVYERAVIGDEVQTGHGVVVREDAEVGSASVIGSYTTIKDGAHLGKGCRLQEAVQVCERAIIGDYVFIGPQVVMTGERYMLGALLAKGDITQEQFEHAERAYREGASVVVEDDVRIGANAVLVAGTHLGKGSIVAAGAVVSGNIPPGCTVAGNPGRIIQKPESRRE